MQKVKVGAEAMESFYLLAGCWSNYKQVKVTGEVRVKNVQNIRFSLLACVHACFVHHPVFKI